MAREKTYVTFWFQHTAARRRLHVGDARLRALWEFQHTAARRRLLHVFYYLYEKG